ncbi:MAG: hypothetical protein EG823_09395 [Actinobacteria bacterium]|nr:hypothetical protein [Actinomycetota bacterium]
MPFEFKNLDERTRALMVDEIDLDAADGTLYLSDNLSPGGCQAYPALLRTAAESGDESTLASALASCLNSHEKPRKLKGGGFSKPPIMRANAHQMLAEGEFNRFYIRAICRRAIQDGIDEVVVYRAKPVEHARSESEAKIGERVSTEALLNDLRSHPGVDTALGLPPGPNSGLCVKLS